MVKVMVKLMTFNYIDVRIHLYRGSYIDNNKFMHVINQSFRNIIIYVYMYIYIYI